jgi:hypothetical protein
MAPAITRKSSVEKRLDLLGGGSIDFYSLDNPDTIRGRKYKRVIINEAGYVPELVDIWNFIIRPTLVDLVGDAIIGGTPKGRGGFWNLWMRGTDASEPDWKSWQFSSFDNPHMSRTELDEMVRTMPERVAQQEVYAAFLDDAGGVFRGVIQAATAQEQEARQEGHSYVIGVDWGRTNDFTVLAVLDMTTKELVHLDRFNQIDYTIQVGRLRGLADKFRPVTIYAEQNSIGDPLIEQLLRLGLPVRPFQTTNASKASAIDALALAFETGGIKILPEPVLIGELQAFEMERLPSGMLRYSAPSGLHDDTVMALALAWQACAKPVWFFAGA